MKLEKWALIAEIVGGIGIVLSLIFVGYEIQQNNQRQVQATTQALVSQYTDVVSLLAQDATLACTWIRGIRDYSSLSGTEANRFSAYALATYRLREDLYFQFLAGEIEPEIWSGFDASTREVFGWPGVQQWFEIRRHWFSERFQAYIDTIGEATTNEIPTSFNHPDCASEN